MQTRSMVVAAAAIVALAAAAPADAGQRAKLRLSAGQAAQLKGMPGVVAERRIPKASRPRKCQAYDLKYYYAGLAVGAGTQRQLAASGASGAFTQPSPALAQCDGHTLAELAVIGHGNDIVEVGWTVDPIVNGDLRPRLFVFHWNLGRPGCYNGCGFVGAPGATVRPGDPVAISATPHDYAIEHAGDRWNVSYAGELIGWFPDSLWGGRFTSAAAVNWFGEIAGRAGSCSDMGTGVFGSAPSGAATITNARLFGITTPILVRTLASPETRALYDDRLLVDATGLGVAYGGPGAC